MTLFLSLCSGIEAASVAWAPMGWKAAAFAEIEAFPSAVLAHHYPDVPNLGDITKFKEWPDFGPVDVVCGGTPCQSFSVAGLRKGLADPRGNLSLTFLAIVDKYRPRYVVWENVPGVLSSDGGRDFAAFLGGLGQLGYGWSFRVLDAQYCRVDGFCAVPQRRRRVFVVGYLGDWRRAAAVLSEPESVCGDTPPRREAGQGASESVARSVAIRGRDGTPQAELGDEVANTILTPNGGRAGVGVGAVLTTFDRQSSGEYGEARLASTVSARDYKSPSDLVAHSLRAQAQLSHREDQDTLIPMVGDTLTSNGDAHSGFRDERGLVPVATGVTIHGTDKTAKVASYTDVAGALRARTPGGQENSSTTAVQQNYAVRRLTPTECERLQGFPDNYTAIPYRGKAAADGPRYKALGNSWAVNVARWVGRRIEMIEQIAAELEQSEAA